MIYYSYRNKVYGVFIMKNEKKRTIESYVEEAKTDIFIYFFVYGFFIIGIILLAIKLQAICI